MIKKVLILTGFLMLSSVSVQALEGIKASWYSMDSIKKEGTFKTSKGIMANGKRFDDSKLTCATRLYPLGTRLLITNKANKKSVTVLVTDRIGKRFAQTRIDLSKAAFQSIADLKAGIIDIDVKQVKVLIK